MHHFLKRLVTPLAILLTSQITGVGAKTIRLVGPDGNIQSAPQYTQAINQNSQAVGNQTSTLYGPTSTNETLWSIASRFRPSNGVSVQQTLLAIYRLNPQAFDNQNIHELIPGSSLRIPSLAQVSVESTEQAVRLLEEHKRKLQQADATPAPRPAPVAPEPKVVATPLPAEASMEEDKVTAAAEQKTQASQSSKTTADKAKSEAVVKNLKDKLNASEGELVALEEKNHQLRLMLSDLQGEVGTLKDELSDENRIRNEVEKMLEEDRKRQAEADAIKPSQLDLLMANKLFVGLVALIPGLLIVLIIVLLITRRKGSDDVQESTTEDTPVINLVDDDIEEINLDDNLEDELLIDDDPFGEGSEDNIFDVDEGDDEPENDVFANLDDSDMDFNLDEGDDEDPFASISDDGDLSDNDIFDESANGISVDGDDEALSLEEMERALDEGVPEPVPGDDSGDLGDFDLADEGEISQDDLNELLMADDPDEALDADELDQSMLDDLFNQTTDEAAEEEGDIRL